MTERNPNLYYTARQQKFRESAEGQAWDRYINALSTDTQQWELQLEGTMWNLFCAMLDDFADNGFPPDSEFRDYGTCFMWAGKSGLWPHGNHLMAYSPIADIRYHAPILDSCGNYGGKLDILLRDTMDGLIHGKPASYYNPNLGEIARQLIEG